MPWVATAEPHCVVCMHCRWGTSKAQCVQTVLPVMPASCVLPVAHYTLGSCTVLCSSSQTSVTARTMGVLRRLRL